jgi:putative nucleotidyltransferase with HDIG domain
MGNISLKKFKLFKFAPRPAAPPDVPPRNGNGKKRFRPWDAFKSPLLWLVLFVLVMSYMVSQIPPKSLPTPKAGEIASRDIVAPADLTVPDLEATRAKQREAADSVLPVYALDPNVFSNVQQRVHQFFQFGREQSGARGATRAAPAPPADVESLRKSILEKFDVEIPLGDLGYLRSQAFPASLEEPLVSILGQTLNRGILISKDLFIYREKERGFSLIRPREPAKTVSVADFPDLREGKALVAAEVAALDLSPRRKTVLTSLAQSFLQPNIALETVETEARRNQAASSVGPILYQIKKDKVIVRKGDEVTSEDLRQIRIINSNLRTTPSWLLNVFGTFLLLTLLFTTMWYYLRSLEKLSESIRIFLLLGLTIILGLAFERLVQFLAPVISQNATFFVLTQRESYTYAIPFQFGALLFAFLTSVPVTVVFVILNSLAAGYVFQGDYWLTIFCLIGGLVAIYGVKYFQRQKRTTVLRAALFIMTPVNLFLILALHMVKERGGELGLLASEAFMALLGGALSAGLAFVLLPIIEILFGFVTAPRLAEMTSSDNPVLRQMAIEAPGSYHHSLIVSALAEKAAEVLKLDPLLIRAGALYHDIGKLKRPEYFGENRIRNIDSHRGLKPSMSRLVIVSHVKDGVEMARKLKLPRRVRDIVEQHHGTNVVKYFYQKAKEKYDPEMQTVGEEQFRYPGPPPQSKEAALVMLADSTEAACRSLRNPTEANLKRVIQELFDGFIQDGELDASGLSLAELRSVGNSFLSTLESMYHPRVVYPGQDFEAKPEAKAEDKANNRTENVNKDKAGPDKGAEAETEKGLEEKAKAEGQ